MTSKQVLALLVGTGLLVVGMLGVLADRLAPCVAGGPNCVVPGAHAACQLLQLLGFNPSPTALGLGFLGAALVLPVIGLVAMIRRWERTRAFVDSLGDAQVSKLPDPVSGAAQDAGLLGEVDLVDMPQPLAFAYGLRHPRVCVSTGLVGALEPLELRAVLTHERVHARSHDPLRLLVGHGLAAMLVWLPVARDLYEHFQVLGEVEADGAVEELSRGRAALASALVKLLAHPAVHGLGRGYAVSRLSATERRIDALLDRTRRPPFVTAPERLVPTIVMLVALLCLLVF